MRKKQPVLFAQKFPNADPLALRLLERLLAFDPKDRPTAEEVLFALLFYKNSKTYFDDMTSTFALFLFSFFCAYFVRIFNANIAFLHKILICRNRRSI